MQRLCGQRRRLYGIFAGTGLSAKRQVVDAAAAQVLGDNLLALIKAMDYRGIPIPVVKRIAWQVRSSNNRKALLARLQESGYDSTLISVQIDVAWLSNAVVAAAGVVPHHVALIGAP